VGAASDAVRAGTVGGIWQLPIQIQGHTLGRLQQIPQMPIAAGRQRECRRGDWRLASIRPPHPSIPLTVDGTSARPKAPYLGLRGATGLVVGPFTHGDADSSFALVDLHCCVLLGSSRSYLSAADPVDETAHLSRVRPWLDSQPPGQSVSYYYPFSIGVPSCSQRDIKRRRQETADVTSSSSDHRRHDPANWFAESAGWALTQRVGGAPKRAQRRLSSQAEA